jgi:hypothetical protein
VVQQVAFQAAAGYQPLVGAAVGHQHHRAGFAVGRPLGGDDGGQHQRIVIAVPAKKFQ